MRAAIAGSFIIALRRVYGPQGATRAEPRIPVDLSAVLTSPCNDRIFARVVDMSQSGLGFEVPDSLAVGTRVSVHFACGIAFGEIKHSSVDCAVFRAGIRIEDFIVRNRITRLGKERAALAVNRTYRNCEALSPQKAFRIHQKGTLHNRWARVWLVDRPLGASDFGLCAVRRGP